METPYRKTILQAKDGNEAKLYQFVMEMTLPQVKKAVLALCEKAMAQHQIQDPVILEALEAAKHAPASSSLVEKFEEEAHQYEVIQHAFQEQMELYLEKAELYKQKAFYYFNRCVLLESLIHIMQDLEITNLHNGLYEIRFLFDKDETTYRELARAKAENQ